jgi:hypothetical protein
VENGNTFNGIDKGAAKYKAYYPGDIITLDANGNVQLPANFWEQTQIGTNTTAHLRNKLLLFDEEANPLNQIFTLALKSTIIKFNLSNIPTSVGTLQKVVWTLETATGVFQSMTLNVNNVTFSTGTTDLTAFLSFNPTIMKIAANGKVRITLLGNQPYVWSTTVTTAKNYTAGKRYTGTSSSWKLNNPLNFLAESNVNSTGTGFVADRTACNVSGYFTWSDAVTRFNTNKNIPGYHLPSIEEWRSIIPQSENYIRLNSTSSNYNYNNVTETVVVQGQSITMTSDFNNSTANNITYAIRYKGTNMVSAWRYELLNYNTTTCHIKITTRCVASTTTIADITNATFWNNNNANDVVHYFPASGRSNGTGRNTIGYFWSSSEDSNPSYGYCMYFEQSFARSSNYMYSKTIGYTVRLFAD